MSAFLWTEDYYHYPDPEADSSPDREYMRQGSYHTNKGREAFNADRRSLAEAEKDARRSIKVVVFLVAALLAFMGYGGILLAVYGGRAMGMGR